MLLQFLWTADFQNLVRHDWTFGELLTLLHEIAFEHDDVLDDYGPHEAGRFVDVAFDRNSGNHVAKFDLAAFIGENRHVIRVPLHKRLALLNRTSIGFGDHRADHHVVTLKLPSL